ncbi:putative pectinesterase 63 [Carica papaya]|uniref:putative pectinesterase 63 n=1 Tax=Carica papaya TaxID=3649 RepID=UPI000B8D1999|nr:putative pectinesterase 63 [Carica papaya]
MIQNTEIHVVDDKGLRVITAQGRNSASDSTGYSFVHCKITGSGTGIYLGRAWMAAPKVVYIYTDMGPVVHPEGWSTNFKPEREDTVFYGEYKCTGPGASTEGRVDYTKQLTNADAQVFLALDYIQGTKWLLPPPKV